MEIFVQPPMKHTHVTYTSVLPLSFSFLFPVASEFKIQCDKYLVLEAICRLFKTYQRCKVREEVLIF
jgi:hypothetical protein